MWSDDKTRKIAYHYEKQKAGVLVHHHQITQKTKKLYGQDDVPYQCMNVVVPFDRREACKAAADIVGAVKCKMIEIMARAQSYLPDE